MIDTQREERRLEVFEIKLRKKYISLKRNKVKQSWKKALFGISPSSLALIFLYY
jgi:hypothetical protein